MKASAIIRIRIITAGILLLALTLVVRLYYIQIIYNDYYTDRAERQYVHTVQDLFNRGSIYFMTKDNEAVSAATMKSGFLLSINPSVIGDPEEIYTKLQSVVPLEKEIFLAHAADTDDTYYEVARHVSKEQGEHISELDVTGVGLYRDQWRYYPGDALEAHAVGFVAFDRDRLVGRYGLERYYEDTLAREDEHLTVNFFAEIFSNLGALVFDTQDTRKGDVVTSIEPTVARTLEAELEKAHKTWNSNLTAGIIIHPKTGDIYALGVYPNFNLNDRSLVGIEAFRNPLVENVYEFGSIIKALTVAAGLDSKVITPQSTYYDAGFIDLDGFTISNFDGRGRGTVSMQEVLNQSLNTGVAHIVEQMGTDTFREYFLNLDLGSETGVDLPNETFGLVENLESPRKVEYATASFGQGIAMTPIGTVRALSTLANGGVLVTPHIGQEIRFENGGTHEISFPEDERVFQEETTEEVTRMLVRVVDEALRGGTRKMDRYSIAAKTGTAQIANSEEGGYYDDRFLHSFFGYFPAFDPEFLIFLYTVEPKQVRYASETLTDPFMNLVTFLINYYNIPPDR